MSLLLQPSDPRPNKRDQYLSEQVEMIFADGVPHATHEADVNAYLVSLRDDPNHTVSIRSIDLQIENITGGGALTGITTIHYLLIGTIDPPYIP